jgi:hypothetical protein
MKGKPVQNDYPRMNLQDKAFDIPLSTFVYSWLMNNNLTECAFQMATKTKFIFFQDYLFDLIKERKFEEAILYLNGFLNPFEEENKNLYKNLCFARLYELYTTGTVLNFNDYLNQHEYVRSITNISNISQLNPEEINNINEEDIIKHLKERLASSQYRSLLRMSCPNLNWSAIKSYVLLQFPQQTKEIALNALLESTSNSPGECRKEVSTEKRDRKSLNGDHLDENESPVKKSRTKSNSELTSLNRVEKQASSPVSPPPPPPAVINSNERVSKRSNESASPVNLSVCTPEQTNSNSQQKKPHSSLIPSSDFESSCIKVQIHSTSCNPSFVPSAIRQLLSANGSTILIGVKDTNDKLFALFYEKATQVSTMMELNVKSETKNKFSKIAITNRGNFFLFYTPGRNEASLFYIKSEEVAERERSPICNFGCLNRHDASLTYIAFSSADDNLFFVGYRNGDISLFSKDTRVGNPLNFCSSPVCHIECLSHENIMYVAVSYTNGSVYLLKYECKRYQDYSNLKYCGSHNVLSPTNEEALCHTFCKSEPRSCRFAIFRDKTAYLYRLDNNTEPEKVYKSSKQIAHATWCSNGKFLNMTDGAEYLIAMHFDKNTKYNISKFTESKGNITALTAFPPQDKANADKIIIGTEQGDLYILETL